LVFIVACSRMLFIMFMVFLIMLILSRFTCSDSTNEVQPER
jgi:L-cystine uptake protein TcyP (sodium:dicarboxylate symporter family)